MGDLRMISDDANYTPEESIRRVRENAEFPQLADIYQYCYENVEDWENGDIDPSDLPHVGNGELFSDTTAAIILRSIAFGCCWEEHVPADSDADNASNNKDEEFDFMGTPLSEEEVESLMSVSPDVLDRLSGNDKRPDTP